MKIIEGRKYFNQEDVKAAVGKSAPAIKRMLDAGKIEPPVAKVGMVHLWNEEQFKRIKQQFGSAA